MIDWFPIMMLAQGENAAPANPSFGETIMPLLLPFAAIFLLYHLIIARPQRKEQARRDELERRLGTSDAGVPDARGLEPDELRRLAEWDGIEVGAHGVSHPVLAQLPPAAQRIEKGGGDFVVICTNTMHRVAEEVQEQIQIPLLRIADATAQRVRSQGLKKVGLLGTKFTMEEAFYKDRLAKKGGLEVVIPTPPEREVVHRVIYDELCLGEIEDASKEGYIQIMDHLVQEGVEGIILGCTEISLLIGQEDSPVPLFDTTRIHAEAAVDYALGS